MLELEFTATDLKQWAYCERIPYYRQVMPVNFARTYKMDRGRNIQDAVEAMERRRGFHRYGLDDGERLFGLWMHSTRLGLSGRPDLLILTADASYPVDFKDTEGGVRCSVTIARILSIASITAARSRSPSSTRASCRVGVR